MTPYMLEILMHHHCSRSAFSRETAPAYKSTVDELVKLGLLERIEFGFVQSTERGRAYLDMVLATPLPVPGFYDPRTGHAVGRAALRERE
ncbi:winged helix-turn-helix domain-containing protein [Brucella anthropi]|uniref:winged helix-turn-helix domain-containing protein n=1 Tax=Brucella anthropi TaxID=529 RepID=UPI001CFDEE7C|nr:winged helix-turn-helix domain-containing protein [Brucella anthropi]